MLRSLTNTLTSSATAGDTLFPIRELFVDRESHRIRYVALDAGGWFNTEEVLVAARLMRPALEDQPGWTLDLTPEAVEAAPKWNHDDGGVPLSVENWPPVVIGPFGHSASPLMIWAAMTASAEERQPPHPPLEEKAEPKLDTSIETLDRASGWLGQPVFGTDGELGLLADMGYDPDTMLISHLVVDNDRILKARRAVFPIQALRHRSAPGGHLVLSVTSADMDTAPHPEDLGLDNKASDFIAPV